MKVVIRADASRKIGSGHIMRCLTLANVLKEKAEVTFLCQEISDDLSKKVRSFGHKILTGDSLSGAQLFDWLIVDHYGLDYSWELAQRKHADNIFVIDDLANRGHDCDILLDQNFYEKSEARYLPLVPKSCKLLLGPSYSLLRPEFYKATKRSRTALKKLLIFFGGADSTNETCKTLRSIVKMAKHLTIDVVVGGMNSFKKELTPLAKGFTDIKIHDSTSNMANLIENADFCFGAGGVNLWERCFLGLPSAVIQVADNQKENTEALEKLGLIFNLGWHQDVTAEKTNDILEKILSDSKLLEDMSSRALEMVLKSEGNGPLTAVKHMEEVKRV